MTGAAHFSSRPNSPRNMSREDCCHEDPKDLAHRLALALRKCVVPGRVAEISGSIGRDGAVLISEPSVGFSVPRHREDPWSVAVGHTHPVGHDGRGPRGRVFSPPTPPDLRLALEDRRACLRYDVVVGPEALFPSGGWYYRIDLQGSAGADMDGALEGFGPACRNMLPSCDAQMPVFQQEDRLRTLLNRLRTRGIIVETVPLGVNV